MKRFLAFVIAMMMLVQTGSSLAEAVTDGTYEAVSEPVGLSMYHIVTFTADGEDVSTIFVVDGAKMESLPEAPVLDGKAFLGALWKRRRLLPIFTLSRRATMQPLKSSVHTRQTRCRLLKKEIRSVAWKILWMHGLFPVLRMIRI